MYTVILLFTLAQSPKQPAYPYPPANPCSNPVKCPGTVLTVRQHLGSGLRK